MRHHTARLRWGALALATLLALAGSGCGGDDDGDDATGSGEETTAPSSDDASAGTTAGGGAYGDDDAADDDAATDDGDASGGTAVEVADFAFSPDRIEVAVGDEVTWTNGDDTAHTVTSDDAAFDLSLDGSGTTASQAFDEAGEFPYHCSIHGSMAGTVVVAEG